MARRDGHVNWVKTCVPCPEWAAKVYPELSPEDALKNLTADIIKIIRLDQPDPVQAWIDHKETLRAKKHLLDSKDFVELHFEGPGTNLKIGLVDHCSWTGGYDTNGVDGSEHIPNVPTEEIFSVPHKYKVNGTVTATLPLNFNGTIINHFGMTIKDGHVIDYHAEQGQDALRSILEHDPGSSYFGEIALVPIESPIYQTGRVFFDTLVDENAVCHIALGNAPVSVVDGGSSMTPEERDAAGINASQLHVDFMIGSDKINVDGITRDGELVPLMRNGSWVN